ncbi:MAG: flagellar basal body-associated FliL family protein [bacterium]|nr:flagellar basal body-associated FliL family protein [bacterium]MCP4966781.1 flagellar basal body-associated FliL family protein [bacterium]
MAEDTATEEDAKKGGKGKLIGIIGGVVVLLGAVYFLFLGGGGGDAEAGVTTTTVVVEGAVIEVDEMTVTLTDDPIRYARLSFAVVLPMGGDSAAVGDRVPVLKDAVLDVMSGYAAADLVGPEALAVLRDELTESALDVYEDGEVIRVVLTEVLIQ